MAKRKPGLDFYPFSDIGRRGQQEDYFYTDPPNREGSPWLGLLADGMGGHESGNIASKEGVHAIRLAFEAGDRKGKSVGRLLADATLKGHEAVLRAAEEAGAAGNMGSTVVSVAIDGSTLHWCSAGDSRLYLHRGGKLVQLTQDFTVGEDMRRSPGRGEWSTEEIEGSPQRNALTSFMGTDNWRTDTGSKPLKAQDVIVVCSDGVYGTIQNEGIAAACEIDGGKATARQIAESMHKRVRDADKSNQDNATAIVVRFDDADGATGTNSRTTWITTGAGVVSAVALGLLVQHHLQQPEPVMVASAEKPSPAPAPAPRPPATVPAPPPVAAPAPAATRTAAPATKVARAAKTPSATTAASSKKADELQKRVASALADYNKRKTKPETAMPPDDAMKLARSLLAELDASTSPNKADDMAALTRMHDEAWTTRLKWNLGKSRRLEVASGPAAALAYLDKDVLPLESDIAGLTRESKSEATRTIEEAHGYKRSLIGKIAAQGAAVDAPAGGASGAAAAVSDARAAAAAAATSAPR